MTNEPSSEAMEIEAKRILDDVSGYLTYNYRGRDDITKAAEAYKAAAVRRAVEAERLRIGKAVNLWALTEEDRRPLMNVIESLLQGKGAAND